MFTVSYLYDVNTYRYAIADFFNNFAGGRIQAYLDTNFSS